jgi:short-subunit dehydrogenase
MGFFLLNSSHMSYALITGASKGIGKEIASQLAFKGYDVLVIARNSYELQMVKEELEKKYAIQADYLVSDLSEAGSVDRIVVWVEEKQIDLRILVNNAGLGLVGQFESYTFEENQKMMHVNMTSLVEMCQKFFPFLVGKGKTHVLNIASATAYQAVPNMSLYAGTKVFVLNFSRGLHHEWKPKGVIVTAVSPGATTTNFNDRANLPSKARKAAEKITMTPESVAKLAVDGMFAGKIEVITGFVNKLAAFIAWVTPKSISEKIAKGIYE